MLVVFVLVFLSNVLGVKVFLLVPTASGDGTGALVLLGPDDQPPLDPSFLVPDQTVRMLICLLLVGLHR